MSFKKILMILAITIFCTGQLQADVGDVIRSFQTPDDFPTGLTYDGKYLWNTDRKTDMLYKIDPKTGEILSTLPSPGYQPEDLAFDGKYIWCLDKEENMIHKLDPETGINVKTIWAPCERPRGMTFDGEYLWLSDIRGDELLQIGEIGLGR